MEESFSDQFRQVKDFILKFSISGSFFKKKTKQF